MVKFKQIELPETIKTQTRSRNDLDNEYDEDDSRFVRTPNRSYQDDERKIFRSNKRIFGSSNRHHENKYSNFKPKLTGRFEPKNDVDSL